MQLEWGRTHHVHHQREWEGGGGAAKQVWARQAGRAVWADLVATIVGANIHGLSPSPEKPCEQLAHAVHASLFRRSNPQLVNRLFLRLQTFGRGPPHLDPSCNLRPCDGLFAPSWGEAASRSWPMRLFSKFWEGAAALGRRDGVRAAAPTQNVAAVGAAPACAAHGHTHTPDSSIVTVEQSDWSSRLAGLSYKPLEKDSQAGRALDGAVDIAGSRLFFGGVIAALTGWAIAGAITQAPDIWQIVLQDVSSIQVCWGGSRWLQCSCHPGHGYLRMPCTSAVRACMQWGRPGSSTGSGRPTRALGTLSIASSYITALCLSLSVSVNRMPRLHPALAPRPSPSPHLFPSPPLPLPRTAAPHRSATYQT